MKTIGRSESHLTKTGMLKYSSAAPRPKASESWVQNIGLSFRGKQGSQTWLLIRPARVGSEKNERCNHKLCTV